MQVVRLWLSAVLLGLGLAGCVPPPVTLTPEAAVQVCEAPTALALRAKDPGFGSLVLEPAATSRIERRAAYVGRQPLALVVAGHGTARDDGSATSDVSYLCLISPSGEAVFVDVTLLSGSTILAECADNPRRLLAPRLPQRPAAHGGARPRRSRGQGGRPRPLGPAALEARRGRGAGRHQHRRLARLPRRGMRPPARRRPRALDRPLPGLPRRPDPRPRAPARPVGRRPCIRPAMRQDAGANDKTGGRR